MYDFLQHVLYNSNSSMLFNLFSVYMLPCNRYCICWSGQSTSKTPTQLIIEITQPKSKRYPLPPRKQISRKHRELLLSIMNTHVLIKKKILIHRNWYQNVFTKHRFDIRVIALYATVMIILLNICIWYI